MSRYWGSDEDLREQNLQVYSPTRPIQLTPPQPRPRPLPTPTRRTNGGGGLPSAAERRAINAQRYSEDPELLGSLMASQGPGGMEKPGPTGLGHLIDNPISKQALDVVELLGYPGRALQSGIKEQADFVRTAVDSGKLPDHMERAVKTLQPLYHISGDAADEASFGDFWDQFTDKEFGMGRVIDDTGNKWLDRTVGFTGDVITDPLTYLSAGAGTALGKGGKASGLIKLATAQNNADEAVRLAGRASVFGDDLAEGTAKLAAARAQRDALEQGPSLARLQSRGLGVASQAQLDVMGLGEKGLRFGGRNGVIIPGSKPVAEAFNQTMGAAKAGIKRVPGAHRVTNIRNPTGVAGQDLSPAYNAIMGVRKRGTPALPIMEALGQLALDKGVQKTGKPFEALAGQVVEKAAPEINKMGEEGWRRLRLNAAQGEKNELTALGEEMHEVADYLGVELPKLDGNYAMPHVLNRKFRNHFKKAVERGDPEAVAFLNDNNMQVIDLAQSSGFNSRRQFLPGTTVEVGKESFDIVDGTVDELNEKFAKLFPGYDGPIYETNPIVAYRRYVEGQARSVGMRKAGQEVADMGFDTVTDAGVAPKAFDPAGARTAGGLAQRSDDEFAENRFYRGVRSGSKTEKRDKALLDEQPEIVRSAEEAILQQRDDLSSSVRDHVQGVVQPIRSQRNQTEAARRQLKRDNKRIINRERPETREAIAQVEGEIDSSVQTIKRLQSYKGGLAGSRTRRGNRAASDASREIDSQIADVQTRIDTLTADMDNVLATRQPELIADRDVLEQQIEGARRELYSLYGKKGNIRSQESRLAGREVDAVIDEVEAEIAGIQSRIDELMADIRPWEEADIRLTKLLTDSGVPQAKRAAARAEQKLAAFTEEEIIKLTPKKRRELAEIATERAEIGEELAQLRAEKLEIDTTPPPVDRRMEGAVREADAAYARAQLEATLATAEGKARSGLTEAKKLEGEARVLDQKRQVLSERLRNETRSLEWYKTEALTSKAQRSRKLAAAKRRAATAREIDDLSAKAKSLREEASLIRADKPTNSRTYKAAQRRADEAKQALEDVKNALRDRNQYLVQLRDQRKKEITPRLNELEATADRLVRRINKLDPPKDFRATTSKELIDARRRVREAEERARNTKGLASQSDDPAVRAEYEKIMGNDKMAGELSAAQADLDRYKTAIAQDNPPPNVNTDPTPGVLKAREKMAAEDLRVVRDGADSHKKLTELRQEASRLLDSTEEGGLLRRRIDQADNRLQEALNDYPEGHPKIEAALDDLSEANLALDDAFDRGEQIARQLNDPALRRYEQALDRSEQYGKWLRRYFDVSTGGKGKSELRSRMNRVKELREKAARMPDSSKMERIEADYARLSATTDMDVVEMYEEIASLNKQINKARQVQPLREANARRRVKGQVNARTREVDAKVAELKRAISGKEADLSGAEDDLFLNERVMSQNGGIEDADVAARVGLEEPFEQVQGLEKEIRGLNKQRPLRENNARQVSNAEVDAKIRGVDEDDIPGEQSIIADQEEELMRLDAEMGGMLTRYQENLDEIKAQYEAGKAAGDTLRRNPKAAAFLQGSVSGPGARIPPTTSVIQGAIDDAQALAADAARLPAGSPEQLAMMKAQAALEADAELLAELAAQEMTVKQANQIIAEARRGRLGSVIVGTLRDDWTKLIKDDPTSNLVMSRDLAASMRNAKMLDQNAGAFGELLGLFTNFFKTYATATPGFHVRNAISAVFMNTVAGASMKHQKQGFQLWREFSKAEDPLGWMKKLRAKDPQAADAFDAVFASGAGGRFFEAGIADAGGRGGKLTEKLFSNKWTMGSQKIGQDWVEGPIRMGLALDATRNGKDLDQALDLVTQVHFNYSQVSEFDARAKMIIPFWTFMSRNLPTQITLMYSKPRVYAQYQSFLDNYSEGNDPLTPDYWLRGGGAINTGVSLPGFGGDDLYITPDLQHNRLNEDLEMLQGLLQLNVKPLASSANPIFTAPYEYSSGEDLFRGFNTPKDATRKAGPLEIPASFIGSLMENGTGTDAQGNRVVNERLAKALQSLVPDLDRATRLAPQLSGDDYRSGTQTEGIARYLGVPIRQLNDNRRSYEAQRQGVPFTPSPPG